LKHPRVYSLAVAKGFIPVHNRRQQFHITPSGGRPDFRIPLVQVKILELFPKAVERKPLFSKTGI
jgi:hypothetical protein